MITLYEERLVLILKLLFKYPPPLRIRLFFYYIIILLYHGIYNFRLLLIL